MKNVLTFLLAGMIITSCVNNTSQNPANESISLSLADSEEIIDELKALTNKLWIDGYSRKDSSLVSELYHPKFQLVDDEGSVFSKGEELAYVAQYGDQYKNFTFTVDKVNIFASGAAEVSANCKFSGTDVGGQVFVTEYYQSLTYSKFPEGWKIIYSQVSGVKETTIEAAPQE